MRLTRILGAALCLPLLMLVLAAGSARAQETTVMGWGLNLSGQIGTGATSTMDCFCIPTPQPVLGVSGVTQIAAGRTHTLALLADGTVRAWGANSHGQLGDGTRDDRVSPIQVPGLTNVVSVGAGDETSLALLADGTLKAWGQNVNGALGVGDAKGPEICPTEIGGKVQQQGCSTRPLTVPGLSEVVAISVAPFYDLALKADGTVFVWGYANKGALGDGKETLIDCLCSPRPIPVPGVTGAVQINGGAEVGAALLADGTVAAWGRNDAGGLGIGNTEVASPSCLCLGTVHVKGVSGARSVAAGEVFGLALLAGGGVMSWGSNLNGELGIGVATPATSDPCGCVPTPGPVSNLSGPSAIAAGERHGLALLPSGAVLSWGSNEHGELGIGSADVMPHPTPTQLPPGGVSAIVAGPEDSFALIGPTHSLSVKFAGAGKGTVGGSGMFCLADCVGRFPDRQVAILRGEGQGRNGFAGFSDGCTGRRSCQVRLDADKTVTATFGVPKGTRISKARINRRRGLATFSSTAPGAIKGFQCVLIKPRAHGKAHGKAKHRKPRFARCAAKKTYRHLPPGRYTFKVRAFDIIGVDAHPAVRHFRIAGTRSAK